MKPAKGVALAVAVGYLISRRRVRTAAVVGAAVAQGELAEGASGGALKQLGHAGMAAAKAALNKPAERFATRLNDAADALREGAPSKQAPTDEAPDERPDTAPDEKPDTAPDEKPDTDDVGAGPDDGHLRTGKYRSRTVKYAQEITSPDDDPERPGRSLGTTHHTVIKQWAEARGATPATVAGTEHTDHLGVLRFDFGGHNENLRPVSWQEWFDTFDSRRLNFIYQEERTDGRRSNFFRLDNPDREDG